MRHKITLDSTDIELAILQWFKAKNKNNIVYNGQWEISDILSVINYRASCS